MAVTLVPRNITRNVNRIATGFHKKYTFLSVRQGEKTKVTMVVPVTLTG